jgi:hypothetical protein
MNTITKPEDIKQWRFVMFMVNTFTFQLEKWITSIPLDAPLVKENKEAIKHLRNKCRKLIELNNVKPLSEVEEEFYDVGDEFHAIMGYIQSQKFPTNYSLLSLCVMLATDDFAGLEVFWRDLGVNISQSKLIK